jgi:hypothetical protein
MCWDQHCSSVQRWQYEVMMTCVSSGSVSIEKSAVSVCDCCLLKEQSCSSKSVMWKAVNFTACQWPSRTRSCTPSLSKMCNSVFLPGFCGRDLRRSRQGTPTESLPAATNKARICYKEFSVFWKSLAICGRPPFGRTAFETDSAWPPYLGFKVHRLNVRWLFLTWKREIFPQGLDVVTRKNTAIITTKNYWHFLCTCGEHRSRFPHGPSNFTLRTLCLISRTLSWLSDNRGSHLITGVQILNIVSLSTYVRIQSDIFDKCSRFLCLVRQRKRVCFYWLTNY